jgi:phosphoglycolate phosphatase-like HAD superfamily hydrolase
VSLILFDIDGTLLLSGGAGVRAMTRAFEDVFGVADAFVNSDVAGRTDTYLVSWALVRAGLPDTPEHHARFRDAYVPILRQEIVQPPRSRSGLMPGIRSLLDALSRRSAAHLALLTGNFERAAYVKLAHFGIEQYFPWGAFGEESADRNDIARAAQRLACERGVPASARERAVVVGDTPHDIACARAIGARILAVATGNFSVEQLQGAGADVALADLADTDRALALLTGLQNDRTPAL